MGRQRNRPQVKEQENSPKEEQNEMEASNLSVMEVRVMVIGIVNSMKKDIANIRKEQSEIKSAMSEINKTLEEINSRLDEED